MKKDIDTLEDSLESLNKSQMLMYQNSTIVILNGYPNTMKSYVYTHTHKIVHGCL